MTAVQSDMHIHVSSSYNWVLLSFSFLFCVFSACVCVLYVIILCVHCCILCRFCLLSMYFSALTLYVGQQSVSMWPVIKLSDWWGAGVVVCLGRGADLHMVQLMPLPTTVSCFSEMAPFPWLKPRHRTVCHHRSGPPLR